MQHIYTHISYIYTLVYTHITYIIYIYIQYRHNSPLKEWRVLVWFLSCPKRPVHSWTLHVCHRTPGRTPGEKAERHGRAQYSPFGVVDKGSMGRHIMAYTPYMECLGFYITLQVVLSCSLRFSPLQPPVGLNRKERHVT